MSQDLEQRTNLAFPTSLTPDEVKEMLNEVSKQGYMFRLVQSGFFNTGMVEGGIVPEDYLTSLSGNVTSRINYSSTGISFKLDENQENYPSFNGLRFGTIPGYDWNEIDPEERSVIESLTKDITDYLAAH
ncbi:MAG: hypothetical protein AABX03_04075 [Nanoarchaeota archaeon]